MVYVLIIITPTGEEFLGAFPSSTTADEYLAGHRRLNEEGATFEVRPLSLDAAAVLIQSLPRPH
jgi:hypothetical protein